MTRRWARPALGGTLAEAASIEEKGDPQDQSRVVRGSVRLSTFHCFVAGKVYGELDVGDVDIPAPAIVGLRDAREHEEVSTSVLADKGSHFVHAHEGFRSKRGWYLAPIVQGVETDTERHAEHVPQLVVCTLHGGQQTEP